MAVDPFFYEIKIGSQLRETVAPFSELLEQAQRENATVWVLGRDMEPYFYLARAVGYENKTCRYLAGLNRECTRTMYLKDRNAIYRYLQKVGFRFNKDYLVDSGFRGSIFDFIFDSTWKHKSVEVMNALRARCQLISGGVGCKYTSWFPFSERDDVYQAVLNMEHAPKREYVRLDKEKLEPKVRKRSNKQDADRFIEGFVRGILS